MRRARLFQSAGLLALGAAVVAVVGASAAPQASTVQVRTVLSSAQEVPAPSGNVSGARGVFTATVTASGSISWRLTFDGLTGNAVAAHIHQIQPHQCFQRSRQFAVFDLGNLRQQRKVRAGRGR